MVTVWEAILLGAVQGVTEWLPISSSGHLAIVQHFLGVGEAVALDVALHIASLLVVLVVFWKDIHWLLVGILRREPKALKMFLLHASRQSLQLLRESSSEIS
jgi:undecaprenyl-diphosphatase